MKKVISISLFVLFISFCMVTIPHSTNAAANADIKMTTTDIGVLDESLQEELLLLSKNSIVIVLSEEDGWSKVQYKTNIGFIRSDNLKKANAQYMLVQSKNEPFVRVTNVQQSDIKGTLYLNSIVEMYSMDSSDFTFVRYGHLAGYVNKHALVKPSEKTMIVKEAKGLVVRSSASPSGEEIGQLVKNTQVKMLTNLKGWAFVTTNEVSGYVLTSGLKTGETKPAASNNKPKTQPKKPVGSGSSLGSKKIALTFDDGPHPKVTLQILKTLENNRLVIGNHFY